jgi:hypothetical protein
VVDTAGDVLICDTADKRIREVPGPAAAAAGTVVLRR